MQSSLEPISSAAADHARIGPVAAHLQLHAGGLALTFDPANTMNLRVPGAQEPRALNLGGRLVALNSADTTVRFEDFTMRSDTGTLAAQGEWNGELDDAATRARTLVLTVSNLDRALLLDGWAMLAADVATPALLADIEQGVILDGKLTLLPSRNADGNRVINWQRSSGTLTLAGLASSGDDLPATVGGTRHARILAWTYEAAARRRRIRSTRRDVRAPRLAAHWRAAITRRAAGRSRLAGVAPRTRGAGARASQRHCCCRGRCAW